MELVNRHLKNLGNYGLHPLAIKEFTLIITKPLFLTFKNSLHTDKALMDWLKVDVIRLVQKGSKTKPNN